jgi:hypothetical protein
VVTSLLALSENRACQLCVAASNALREQMTDQDRPADVRVQVIFDLDKASGDGRDILRYEISEQALCKFELAVSASPDRRHGGQLTLLNDVFRGRIYSPSQCVEAIRQWRESCRSHSACDAKQVGVWPRRTILIETGYKVPKLRLHEGVPESEKTPKYVLLSFTWGKDDSTRKLTTANMDSFLQHIDLQGLPELHRDAIQVAHDLGYRHIWIDALCVLQGSAEDWGSENGVELIEYLRNADMVFSSTTSSTSGALPPRPYDTICRFVVDAHRDVETDPLLAMNLEVSNSLPIAKDLLQQYVLNRGW